MNPLESAYRALEQFKGGSLKRRISVLERTFRGTTKTSARPALEAEGIALPLLDSALTIKRASAQIDEVVHALGILLCLPDVLNEGECVENLSLAAGNTGRTFDLQTNSRIAEFKFIDWKGGPESIRQNQLFKDFYWLAEAETEKQRFLYVLGLEYPLKFLQGGRALRSVMSKDATLREDFQARYRETFSTVGQYYSHRRERVALVDLTCIL